MSEDLPGYRPCEVELEFGDGFHTFKLTLKTIAELQEKCGAGIGEIRRRLIDGDWRAEDCVETVRLGLVGAGMSGPEAKKLIDRYCDRWPLEVWHQHALAVVLACVHGYVPPETSDPEKKTKSRARSTSSEPMATPSH